MIRALRRAIKPALLWWNAWCFKQSEEDIVYFASFRLHLSAQEHQRRVRQRKLQAKRDRIHQW
jgi:hypothetical protein